MVSSVRLRKLRLTLRGPVLLVELLSRYSSGSRTINVVACANLNINVSMGCWFAALTSSCPIMSTNEIVSAWIVVDEIKIEMAVVRCDSEATEMNI